MNIVLNMVTFINDTLAQRHQFCSTLKNNSNFISILLHNINSEPSQNLTIKIIYNQIVFRLSEAKRTIKTQQIMSAFCLLIPLDQIDIERPSNQSAIFMYTNLLM